MRSTVAQFCKKYGTCALTKDSTQYAHGALQPLPVPPAQFHSYTLDFVTNLSPAWGFNCVLTFIDHLTKFRSPIPCTMGEDKLSAAQVSKSLFENIFRFFVVPKELVHDHDPKFTDHLWCELWCILATKTSTSTAFHPQSNAQSECTNHMLEQILQANICNKPPSAWLDALPFAEFANNSTISQSTGYSPFIMLYGQQVPLPFDHALEKPSNGTMQPETASSLTNVA